MAERRFLRRHKMIRTIEENCTFMVDPRFNGLPMVKTIRRVENEKGLMVIVLKYYTRDVIHMINFLEPANTMRRSMLPVSHPY
jgi:hypothetical protein